LPCRALQCRSRGGSGSGSRSGGPVVGRRGGGRFFLPRVRVVAPEIEEFEGPLGAVAWRDVSIVFRSVSPWVHLFPQETSGPLTLRRSLGDPRLGVGATRRAADRTGAGPQRRSNRKRGTYI
jgi:hypothetical protein